MPYMKAENEVLEGERVVLDIAIVGGGIAGLAAAIAFRRTGHKVTVYEQSRFANEIGAAIHCAPNATRVLDWLNFDFEKSGAVSCVWSYLADGTTAQVQRSLSLAHMTSEYGHPWLFFHRVDLHNGLKELAFGDEGEGPPVVLKLQSKVTSVDPSGSKLHFVDGSTIAADVVIGADGIHSVVSQYVVGEPVPAHETGQSAFRFLVPIARLMEDPETQWLVEDKPATMNIFKNDDRRLVAYPCKNSELINCVAIHPDMPHEGSTEEWNKTAPLSELMEAYSSFHPSFKAICKHATDMEDLKLWKLLYRPPIPTWTKGNICLIGDAAHPMLPHQGQGGGMSVEDAGALGVLLANLTSKDQIPERLETFQKMRYNRASAVQIFSNYGQDEAEKMAAEASKYCSGKVPSNQVEFHNYMFPYNVMDDARSWVSKENGIEQQNGHAIKA